MYWKLDLQNNPSLLKEPSGSFFKTKQTLEAMNARETYEKMSNLYQLMIKLV